MLSLSWTRWRQAAYEFLVSQQFLVLCYLIQKWYEWVPLSEVYRFKYGIKEQCFWPGIHGMVLADILCWSIRISIAISDRLWQASSGRAQKDIMVHNIARPLSAFIEMLLSHLSKQKCLHDFTLLHHVSQPRLFSFATSGNTLAERPVLTKGQVNKCFWKSIQREARAWNTPIVNVTFMCTFSRRKNRVKPSSPICASLSGQPKLTNPLDRSGVLTSQIPKTYVEYNYATVCKSENSGQTSRL